MELFYTLLWIAMYVGQIRAVVILFKWQINESKWVRIFIGIMLIFMTLALIGAYT